MLCASAAATDLFSRPAVHVQLRRLPPSPLPQGPPSRDDRNLIVICPSYLLPPGISAYMAGQGYPKGNGGALGGDGAAVFAASWLLTG